MTGILNGAMRVYVDPIKVDSEKDLISVFGGKTNEINAGVFYCPYIPLTYVNISLNVLRVAEPMPVVEDVSEDGRYLFLLRCDGPDNNYREKAAEAFHWIRKNVPVAYREFSHVDGNYGTNKDGTLAPEASMHQHILVEFFNQKDAALFKLLHL